MDFRAYRRQKRDRALCRSAAHLVASLLDPGVGVSPRMMHDEVRDSLAILRAELTAAGYMTEFIHDGEIGLGPLAPSEHRVGDAA